MNSEISVFLSKLLCFNRILLAAHVGPDADAIGSIVALGEFLRIRGKEVYLYVQGGCPENCSFLAGGQNIMGELTKEALTAELLLLVDCSELKRTGITPDVVEHIKNRAVLDHHIPKADIDCRFSCIDSDACSTAILVYKLIMAADSQPDMTISEAILTGIVGDTGVFRFSNTTPEVLSVSSDLMERGARLHCIVKNYFMSRPQKAVRLLGNVLANLRYFYEGKAAVAVITNDMLAGINKNDLEGINEQLSGIKDLRLSVLLREEVKGYFRCSFRSDDFVDCSRLAAAFNGGGHKNAAGCTIAASDSEEAIEKIMNEVAVWKASFV